MPDTPNCTYPPLRLVHIPDTFPELGAKRSSTELPYYFKVLLMSKPSILIERNDSSGGISHMMTSRRAMYFEFPLRTKISFRRIKSHYISFLESKHGQLRKEKTRVPVSGSTGPSTGLGPGKTVLGKDRLGPHLCGACGLKEELAEPTHHLAL